MLPRPLRRSTLSCPRVRVSAVVAAVCCWLAASPTAALAQRNSAVDLLDSPVKTDEVYQVGEVIICSLALPGTAALFGCDTLTGSSGPVIMYSGELFGAFRVWEYDEGCTPTATWSTVFAGATMTGLASPNGDTTKYWVVNPGGSADEHDYGVGTATGTTVPLVAAGLLGAGVVDDNVGGEILCVDDIVLDNYTCVDTAAAGSFVCSFVNADNTGGGAFGNSVGDAVTPGDCGGGTLVATVLFCRRHAIPIFRFADLLVCAVPIGLLLGRIANFINAELWGRPTDMPWAMVFPTDPEQLPRHPSQLYEAGLEGLVLLVLLNGLALRSRLGIERPGTITGLFFIGYGLARYVVEFFRAPDAHLGLLAGLMSMGQLLSLPMIARGVWFIWKAGRPAASRAGGGRGP